MVVVVHRKATGIVETTHRFPVSEFWSNTPHYSSTTNPQHCALTFHSSDLKEWQQKMKDRGIDATLHK